MAAACDTQPVTDGRREPRTNMFVLAMIHSAAGSSPVKIRDMSRHGALIEAPTIPPVGSHVRLCRSSLSLSGRVVWIKDGRAGLLFEGAASVSEWLPRKVPPGQQLADRLFQEKREKGNVSKVSRASSAVVEPATVTALEVASLRRAIESLAEDLADDTAVLAKHGPKLQTLDLAAQILGKLAREI